LQLTENERANFDSGERLLRFTFSRDGKQLALVRGWETNDVLLINP
jgi:hypothetical protein